MKQPEERISNFDFSIQKTAKQHFENCEFVNCIFSDLSNLNFSDCLFKTCNLSNLQTKNALFQNVTLKDCKLLGLNFSTAKDFAFELHFENCLMDYASFDKKKLNKSTFKNCKMHDVNFTQADLSKCSIENCDFLNALFMNTNLSALDFTTSKNFAIDPELNTIKKARFFSQQLEGLLYRHDIIIE